MSRRDDEPLACPERSVLHARHVGVPRQLERGHREPPRGPSRQQHRERVLDPGRVVLAPGRGPGIGPVPPVRLGYVVRSGGEEIIPRRIGGPEEVRRPRLQHRLEGLLVVEPRPPEVGVRLDARREDRVEDPVGHREPEGAHDPVAHRVGVGPALPFPGGLEEVPAGGLAGDDLRAERREEQGVPALEKDSAVVQLDAQEVARSDGLTRARKRLEVVPDLVGPRADVVLGVAEDLHLVSAHRPVVCGQHDCVGGRIDRVYVLRVE